MKKGGITVIMLAGIALAAACTWHEENATSAITTLNIRSLAEKLNRLIVPDLPPSGVTLKEAVEYLRIKSRELDTTTTWAKGVNLVLISGAEKRLPDVIDLKLKDVRLSDALRHITEAVGMKYTVDPHAVAIRAAGDMRGASLPGRYPTAMEQRLQKRILPTVQFEDATLEEAVEFIRLNRGCLDSTGGETPPPLNFVVKVRGGVARSPISLDLKDIPLGEALRYVAEISGARLRFDPFAVMVTDAAVANDVARRTIPSPGRADSIILPEVQFAGATLDEAVEFVHRKSRQIDPKSDAVGIIVKPGGDPNTPINLSLKSIPLTEMLRYVAELSDHKLDFDGQAFVLTPNEAE